MIDKAALFLATIAPQGVPPTGTNFPPVIEKPIVVQVEQPDFIKQIQAIKPIKPIKQFKTKKIAKLSKKPVKPQTAVRTARVAFSGNTYVRGNCTWFAKSRRPDLPNNLGNANTWYYRASRQGYAVGLTPRVGAVATTASGKLGHVAIVIGVSGDTVTVREMNFKGLGVISTRITLASSFKYIY